MHASASPWVVLTRVAVARLIAESQDNSRLIARFPYGSGLSFLSGAAPPEPYVIAVPPESSHPETSVIEQPLPTISETAHPEVVVHTLTTMWLHFGSSGNRRMPCVTAKRYLVRSV
jgi:hypothetical protein